MRVFAVIPVLDEAEGLKATLAEIPADLCEGVVVVDGGSKDGSRATARAFGAIVVVEKRPGYGRAVETGLEVARQRGAEAMAIFDGNGTIDGTTLRRVLEPLLLGNVDLVCGWRTDRSRLRPLQRLGNRIAIQWIARRHGLLFSDISPVRAITATALETLALHEPGHGWPLAFLARAAARGLRVYQVPVTLRPRLGRSKVSGTALGTLRAGTAFLRILLLDTVRASFLVAPRSPGR